MSNLDPELDELIAWLDRIEEGLKRHPEFLDMTHLKPFLEQLDKDELEGNVT